MKMEKMNKEKQLQNTEKYTEILRLKTMLEKAHIPFFWKEKHFDGHLIAYPDKGERCVCSVVEFNGSYGASGDLLEIMGLMTEKEKQETEDDVLGWLTAEDVFSRIQKHYQGVNQMTIEEMKANGYTRYSAFISKYIVTKEVEVWAKDWDDAHAILEKAAETLPDSAFEDRELPEIQQLESRPVAAAQSIIAEHNEDFYKHEEE